MRFHKQLLIALIMALMLVSIIITAVIAESNSLSDAISLAKLTGFILVFCIILVAVVLVLDNREL